MKNIKIPEISYPADDETDISYPTEEEMEAMTEIQYPTEEEMEAMYKEFIRRHPEYA